VKKILFLVLISFTITGLFNHPSSFAANTIEIEKQANKDIGHLYHLLKQKKISSMTKRIDWISAQFKNQPYLLGALGEGADGRFDQYPKYRTDAFDCQTYVTTVLALAFANNRDEFSCYLKQIRYMNGKRSFLKRNHFASVDWNINNQKKGFIKDITLKIKERNNQPIAKTANAVIYKPGWYSKMTVKNIRLENIDKDLEKKRLQELKEKGQSLEVVKAKTPYLPLNKLLKKNREKNEYLFRQIPNGAIIEIIRPNWNLKGKIGTNLNVSHTGFAIWKKGILYYRNASSLEGKVVDVPLSDYLKKIINSPTIKGINLQMVVPETTSKINCK